MDAIVGGNHIQLWCVQGEAIRDAVLQSQYLKLICTDEKNRLKNIIFSKHRDQFLITRVLVRTALSFNNPHIHPSQWEFATNKHGRPTVSYPVLSTKLFFSISHTNDFIVVAVSLDKEIGVDVECLRNMREYIDIAKEYFSAHEVEQLLSLPRNEQRARFFVLWTLKEAYVKARGKGLSLPLDEFEFSFPTPSLIKARLDSSGNENSEIWEFWTIQPKSQYFISLAKMNNDRDTFQNIFMYESTPLMSRVEVNYPIIMQSDPIDIVLV